MRREVALWLMSFIIHGVVALPFIYFISTYVILIGACFKLPTGLEIGREAYLDLSRPYFKPVVVLREPDGTVIGQEVAPLHLTDKAAYGWALIDYDDNIGHDFKFIWTRETGTVKNSENPALYERLMQDPGDVYYGATKEMNVNTLWYYMRFKEQNAFRSRSCKMAWVTW